MTDISKAGRFRLGDKMVGRMGYGAMQLAGPGVFGPPKDRPAALKVLRDAIAAGVDHIDTCDYYGPHIVNQLIKEALHPYPDDLVIVTKIGFFRAADGNWFPAQKPADLKRAVHDNLRNLGVDVLEVVNLRLLGDGLNPTEDSIEQRFSILAELREQGLIRHLGLSNVTAAQVDEALAIAPVVCVQNQYNMVQRADHALVDILAAKEIAYVPFFPLGGLTPIQSKALTELSSRLNATSLQVALAWLLAHAPNILLIPGTSSPAHLAENLAAAELKLSDDIMSELERIVPAARSGSHR